jgi:hypothetical protein
MTAVFVAICLVELVVEARVGAYNQHIFVETVN